MKQKLKKKRKLYHQLQVVDVIESERKDVVKDSEGRDRKKNVASESGHSTPMSAAKRRVKPLEELFAFAAAKVKSRPSAGTEDDESKHLF